MDLLVFLSIKFEELKPYFHAIAVASFAAFITVLLLPKIKENLTIKAVEEDEILEENLSNDNVCNEEITNDNICEDDSHIKIVLRLFKNGDPYKLIVSAKKKNVENENKIRRIVVKNNIK